MCGILGWVGLGSQPPALNLDRLRHRGPDDSGLKDYRARFGRAAARLGSTRLAILDLSSAGHMPMDHPAEPISITFNGEIYNFQELRAELERSGERFLSRTDTEVLLCGYRVWGDRVVERLRGMFAFAIWDGRGEGRLLLARDRFGKKPLYYRQDPGGSLWFASELKAILGPATPREVDPSALAYYLDRGYPPPDRCMLRGYRKLPAGHSAVWAGAELRTLAYWQPQDEPDGAPMPAGGEAARTLRGLLDEAVRVRLVADVPVGALLSGGLDSSSIVALMSRHAPPGGLRTYTACFGAGQVDESEDARQIALKFGSRHRAIMVNPRSGRLLPFIASHMDEPIADPSAVATYLICRRARQEVTVLLSGDGSDEILLGYPRYRLHAASQLMSSLPRQLRMAVARAFPHASIPERALSAPADPVARDRYWLNHGARAEVPHQAGRRPSPQEAVRAVLREDISSWLVEDVLTKVDKMAMAASVEVRSPFLDQPLADWALKLPVWRRMSWLHGKQVLRDALQDVLPIVTRRRAKQPFLLPVDEWLRCEWRTLVEDVLLDPATLQRGWCDEEEVRRMLAEHFAGVRRHGRRLYQLLVLELWARAILDGGEAESIPGGVDDCCRELPADRPVRKVAVIAPAGIGDTVRLTPAIAAIGRADPAVSVTIYVSSGQPVHDILSGRHPVDRHVPLPFASVNLRKFVRLVQDARANEYDLLASTWVSLMAPVAGWLAGARMSRGWTPRWSPLTRFTGVFWGERFPYDPPRKDVGYYDAEAFSRLLGHEGKGNSSLYFSPPIWEERALKEARLRLRELRRPILAVNSVPAWRIPQRAYPGDLMCRALRALLDCGAVGSVILLGDLAAADRLRAMKEKIGDACLEFGERLSLSSTAALIRECDAMLSIDGGLLHVALATDLPLVALYGPTEIYSRDPRENGRGFASLSAFDRCRCLCQNHRGMRAHASCRSESQCLRSIPFEQVVEAVSRLIEADARRRGEAAGPAGEGRRAL